MQGVVAARSLDLLPGLSGVVQLQTGSAVSLNSTALAMALMAGPSRAGEWSAVVGVPDFGFEAAAEFGLDLDRTVVVPDPGEHWLSVTAGLIDIAGVILLRPPRTVTAHEAERLRSRLRQKDAALLALGSWPRAQARLDVHQSSWLGLGAGHGHLTARRVLVRLSSPGAPERHVAVWLPGTDLEVRHTDHGYPPALTDLTEARVG